MILNSEQCKIKNNSKFHCNSCSTNFACANKLRLHISSIHEGKHSLLCNKQFASIYTLSKPNVCPAEKRTKRSSNILLCLVRFSAGQTLAVNLRSFMSNFCSF